VLILYLLATGDICFHAAGWNWYLPCCSGSIYLYVTHTMTIEVVAMDISNSIADSCLTQRYCHILLIHLDLHNHHVPQHYTNTIIRVATSTNTACIVALL
jgi:hypothetical protein